MDDKMKLAVLREAFPGLCWEAWGAKIIALAAMAAENLEAEGHEPFTYDCMLRNYAQLRRVRLRVLDEMIQRAFAASAIIEEPEEVYREMKEVLRESRISSKQGS